MSGFDSWRQQFISVCNQPPRSTQPSTLRGTVKWIPAKGRCGDVLWLGSKGRHGVICRQTCVIHVWAHLRRFAKTALYKSTYTLLYIYMVHVIWPRPFQGWFAMCGLALATINLSTKFEVSISTLSPSPLSAQCEAWFSALYKYSYLLTYLPTTKIWKVIQNVKMGWFGVVRGHWRSVEIASFDRAHASAISVCPYVAPIYRYSEILFEIIKLVMCCWLQ